MQIRRRKINDKESKMQHKNNSTSATHSPSVSGVGQEIDYEGIDETMRPLIRALNSHPDVQTFACCEGHGREQLYIWLAARSRDAREFLRQGASAAFHTKEEDDQLMIYRWNVILCDVRPDLTGGDDSWEGLRIECPALDFEKDARVREFEIWALARCYERLLARRGIALA